MALAVLVICLADLETPVVECPILAIWTLAICLVAAAVDLAEAVAADRILAVAVSLAALEAKV